MTPEEIKALDRRYVDEVLNGGKLDAIDEICSEDYVGHVAGQPDMNREGDKQLVGMLRSAFPDLRFTLLHQLCDGDLAVHHGVGRGTHKGELMGIPPTGRQVEITGINVNRFDGGKLVESWGVLDMLSLMQQLGVVPAPGQQPAG